MLAVVVILVMLLVALVLQSWVVWLMARRLEARRGSFPRVLLAMVGVSILSVVPVPASIAAESRSGGIAITIQFGALLFGFAASVLLLRAVLALSLRQATMVFFVVWLTGLLGVIPLGLFFKPKIAETFRLGGNSMAPTLVGWHGQVECRNCGHLAIIGRDNPGEFHASESVPMPIICPNCWEQDLRVENDVPLCSPDCVLVDKLSTPRRWDVVAFRHPNAHRETYLARLIGLPGEQIELRDDVIFVNGQKQTPPQSIAGIRYLTDWDGNEFPDLQTAWQLGPEQIIVLGDCSINAFDSRFFGPIPRSNLRGVAKLRYAPLRRFGRIP